MSDRALTTHARALLLTDLVGRRYKLSAAAMKVALISSNRLTTNLDQTGLLTRSSATIGASKRQI